MESIEREADFRCGYLKAALADIPRLLGAIDRSAFRPTYGCLDRQYWHYRTASFPSEMYQEGVLPLALVYSTNLPGNRWFRSPRVGELAEAALQYTVRSGRADGSCDDYYPFERALGAAVFSLQAATRAYVLLELNDAEIVAWFRRRAEWLIRNDESGRLANHHALAALGLLRVAEITGDPRYRRAADARIGRVLGWQDEEGWFEEYGGADPGYQTVTIDCLAKYREATGDTQLDEPLERAVAFARLFLHPDDSYAGPYGSRGTSHFYPHGMELLARRSSAAADLADAFLRSLAKRTHARFDDDRLFAHRLGNLIEAYLDWSPVRSACEQDCRKTDFNPLIEDGNPLVEERNEFRSTRRHASAVYLPNAQILVRRHGECHTVISAARGGVFKHFSSATASATDAGLIVEIDDGRVAVSQWHDRTRPVERVDGQSPGAGGLFVGGPLCWCRFETATPLKQALLHFGMWSLGRWCRTLVRRLLQRRLITGRSLAPIRLTRRFEFLADRDPSSSSGLRVTDTIELTSPRVRVRRMAFGTDHEAAYVAATGGYQEAVLEPWTDLARYVEELNCRRQVTIIREFKSA